MGTSDGTVQGITKILNNGPDASRMNIVLVAEGFDASEQTTFDNLCSDFVASLQAEPWYPIIGDAINVHQLNVASTDSGTDEPATCADGETGSGNMVNTYFDSSFCNSDIWRCLSGSYSLVRTTLDTWLPAWHIGAVLVNTTDHGGCANGDVFFTCVKSGWENIALHELGHAAFDLADEYQYWAGCGSGETGHDNAPSWEPGEFNVTTETDRDDLKWRHLLTPGVPVPTMENPDCSKCDERANVISDDDAIGLFEGAQYYHCGRFRAAYRCRMRNNSNPYCRVCVEQIARRLNEYVAATPNLEVHPQLLDFGDVVHGLTLYLAFEVRNVRAGRPAEMEINLGLPSGDFAYAPGTETNFTLPAPVFEAYTSRNVYVAFTSLTAGGPAFTGQLTVSTPDDPVNPSVDVDLLARAVAPMPVDSVLVIDRSGSMDGATGVPNEQKIHHAIFAAELYVSLLKDNDKIGVVRYNQNSDASDILLNLRTAGDAASGAGRLAARGVLNTSDLNPDGYTSIGGGIINGSGVLDSATADARAIVVLTDGIQNRLPDVPTATTAVSAKTPTQRVFAVGLGLNQLEDTLHQIASVTNGTAEITGELVDEKEFILQKLFVQILSDVADENFVHDPKLILPPGQRKSTPIYIGDVDVAADFIIVYRQSSIFPKYMRVELEAPDGTKFRPVDIGSIPNAEFVFQPGHMYYRWQFPCFPDKPQMHQGCWKVWVENFVSDRYENEGSLIYSVMAKARSNLRLGGRILQTGYKPGSAMTIVLEPTLFGLPVELDTPVRVSVQRPDGVVRQVTLARDEFGAYKAEFGDTGLVGPYTVRAEVSATSPGGYRVTRYRQMTGIIFIKGQDGGEWDGDERLCRRAGKALKILEELIRRCCRPKKDEDIIKLLQELPKNYLIAEITRRLDDDDDPEK